MRNRWELIIIFIKHLHSNQDEIFDMDCFSYWFTKARSL